jgi:hypothetical protein
VFALGAVVASGAQAETAPSFTIGGARLEVGKTHNIDAKAFKPFVLIGGPAGSIRIECKALGTENAVLLGSSAGNPGKDNETTVFSQCALTAGNGFPNCELSNEAGTAGSTVIKTEPTKSEQVENVEGGHGGKKLYEEFIPASKAKGFVTLFFRGTGCTFKETTMSGSVVAEDVTDNTSETSVELGQAPQERTSSVLQFPSLPIGEVWLISGGVGKIQETGETWFGEAVVQTGTELVLLANTKFVPEPNALWSPLP